MKLEVEVLVKFSMTFIYCCDIYFQIMRDGMEVSDKGYNWSDKLLKLSGQLYAIDEQRGRSAGTI